MSEQILQNLGIWTAICAAFLALIVAQSLLLVGVGIIGKRLWSRVTRVYHLQVIAYWLDRLEREGTHCFEKAAAQHNGEQG